MNNEIRVSVLNFLDGNLSVYHLDEIAARFKTPADLVNNLKKNHSLPAGTITQDEQDIEFDGVSTHEVEVFAGEILQKEIGVLMTSAAHYEDEGNDKTATKFRAKALELSKKYDTSKMENLLSIFMLLRN